MKREIVFDTETTGFKPEDGHKIIELGAVEMIDGRKTGRVFQTYINPQRDIPEDAAKVHGITNEDVKDAPTFEEACDKFLNFIKDAEIIGHNVEFDIKFMNAELNLANRGSIWDYVTKSTCTLRLDQMLYPKERRHTLDAMCERFGIDLSRRQQEGHGALLDCELLADCYIEVNKRFPADRIEAEIEQTNWVRPEIVRFSGEFAKVNVSPEDEQANQEYLDDVLGLKRAPSQKQKP